MNTDTPETDAILRQMMVANHPQTGGKRYAELMDSAVSKIEALERERDELRKAVRTLQDAKGRHHSQIAAEKLFKLLP